MVKKIFIAVTGQHKGKTTSTLGIIASLKSKGLNVGYCKPVGQYHLEVNGQLADKDTVLFADALGFEVDPEIHSPVILASGVTAKYIADPSQFDFVGAISKAANILETQHDVVVYEGTGHIGVGSVINLSNAKVAKMLDAEVVLIVGGGIGRTIDQLNLNLALFREEGVIIKGVIVNKVHSDKLNQIRPYLEKWLTQRGIPLLGFLPYDPSLSFPILSTIKKKLKAKVMFNTKKTSNRVEEILAGSLTEIDEFTYFQNVLLVVNAIRYREAVKKIETIALQRGLESSPLCGVLVTCNGRHDMWYKKEDFEITYLQKHSIPVMTTTLGTYDAVVAINRIEVKINTQTPWKVSRAIELIDNHIDFGLLI